MNTEFIFFNRQIYNQSYQIHPHVHPCFELVYYLSGEGTVNINNVDYKFKPNCFAFPAPNEIHSESSRTPATVLFIGFKTDRLLPKKPLAADHDGDILKTMLEIANEMNLKRSYYSAILNTLTEKLVYLVLRKAGVEQNKEEYFRYILNYFNVNANQNISIKQIAFNLGYNADYLGQLFLANTGKTAKNYLTEIRLKNVCEFLLNFDYSLNKIAELTGFSSASHLCLIFKKYYGISPLEYKKQEQKKVKTSSLVRNV